MISVPLWGAPCFEVTVEYWCAILALVGSGAENLLRFVGAAGTVALPWRNHGKLSKVGRHRTGEMIPAVGSGAFASG